MAISIVLADDHPLVRQGMREILDREPDFSIAGVAADGLETVRLTERLKPDVLVLDLRMPGLSGLEALRILRERSPQTQIVILSFYSSNAFIAQALKTERSATSSKAVPKVIWYAPSGRRPPAGVSSVRRAETSISLAASLRRRRRSWGQQLHSIDTIATLQSIGSSTSLRDHARIS